MDQARHDELERGAPGRSRRAAAAREGLGELCSAHWSPVDGMLRRYGHPAA